MKMALYQDNRKEFEELINATHFRNQKLNLISYVIFPLAFIFGGVQNRPNPPMAGFSWKWHYIKATEKNGLHDYRVSLCLVSHPMFLFLDEWSSQGIPFDLFFCLTVNGSGKVLNASICRKHRNFTSKFCSPFFCWIWFSSIFLFVFQNERQWKFDIWDQIYF